MMKKIAWLIIFSILLSGASVTKPDQDIQIVHVLNRLAFGPRPGDIDKVKAQGIKAYIQEQLNPPIITEYEGVQDFGTPQGQKTMDLFQQYQVVRKRAAAEEPADQQADRKQALQKATQQFFKGITDQYSTIKLQRAINSPWQLEEVMTEFWFNHFNISMNKGLDRMWVGSYEDEAIRPYALGRFRDLLGATCHHPAMLFYLDNWQNTAPNSAGARGQFKGLNENYARELMELHTLGVDGGYTQKDVIELARILTGLGLPSPRGNGPRAGFGPRANLPIGGPLGRGAVWAGRAAFGRGGGPEPVDKYGAVFDRNRHDFGDKVLLGHRIPGAGEEEIERSLDMLARHPSTAHHLSYQLAQYFVADNPPKALVDRLALRFTQTDGDIKAVLSELFKSPEFWDERYQNNKYKSPFRYVVSSIRATGVEPTNYKPLKQFLQMQGEQLYGCLTPDGYKSTTDAWLNPDSLLRRINFATGLGLGRLPGNEFDPPEYRLLGATMRGGRFSPQTVQVVANQPEQLRSALLLGSPEFLKY